MESEMNNRFLVTAIDWPSGRVHSQTPFRTLQDALTHAERHRAVPPARQNFRVQIRDRSRATGDAELCWDSLDHWN
jgi:hypothetical protein